jgi:uncharacterized protein
MGAVIYGVYFIFFKKPDMIKKSKKDDSETVVECQECGVYISMKEAVFKDGKEYCSKECARLK